MMKKEQIQQQALANAVTGQSVMNYDAIFNGFIEKGVPGHEILPRENVFTFNAWKAKGRYVRKGESGVKVVTWIPCQKADTETGEIVSYKKPHTTTVFHISQTEAMH